MSPPLRESTPPATPRDQCPPGASRCQHHASHRIASEPTQTLHARRRTIRISCRGRLQDLHAARNQYGGPGQLHPFVRPCHITICGTNNPYPPPLLVLAPDGRRGCGVSELDRQVALG